MLFLIYISFISLGLPDPLLGAAWPSMYEGMGVPLSYAGILSMIVAFGTIVSSLMSDRLTKKLGVGHVTLFSVGLTALALFGYSTSTAFWMLILWSIPYGIGAGGVDAALNNYVAVHYSSRHMSWLHCMWGLGTIIGPTVMGRALSSGWGWTGAYRAVFLFQVVLVAVLYFRRRSWKAASAETGNLPAPISLGKIVRLSGVPAVMLTFFCYCALESTALLWASSYLVFCGGYGRELAAGFSSLFFIGITLGRALNGFLTIRFSDKTMIRAGQGIIFLGIVTLFLPVGSTGKLAALLLIGLGCAPVYPCIIHSTPYLFGTDKSQAIIGVEMASAYAGTCLMPPLFGILSRKLSLHLLPWYLGILLFAMVLGHEYLERTVGKEK